MAERAPPEIIPNPDPSTITSQAIDRAVNNAVAVVDARIDGMQKAVEVFQADLTRVPTAVDRAIQGLRELQEARFKAIEENLDSLHKSIDPIDCDIRKEIGHLHALMDAEIDKLSAVTKEHFEGIATQFATERITRTERAGDTKLAVDAAFAAAKESTSKIEAGFTKAIDSMLELFKTSTKAADDKISDLKDRLTAMEARTQGIGTARIENREHQSDSRALVFSVVGTVIALAVAIATIMAHLSK